MLEELQKEGGARRSQTSNRMLAVARARVQGNGNNVIVLINRDTASVPNFESAAPNSSFYLTLSMRKFLWQAASDRSFLDWI